MTPRKPGIDDASDAPENAKKRQRVELHADENAVKNTSMLAPAPKRPKRKKIDAAYHPHQQRTPRMPSANQPVYFYGRAETSQEIKTVSQTILAPIPKRPPIPYITSILLDLSLLSSENDSSTESANESEMGRRLMEQFGQRVESYKPIKEIRSYSPGGTPSTVIVEVDDQEEILTAKSRVGVGIIFSNDPNQTAILREPTKEVCKSNPALQSSALTKVKPAAGKSKIQEATITQESLKKTRRENRAHPGRSLSQNKALAAPRIKESEASASKYAGFVEISRERANWEWLHLIAHQILGEKSQTESNLVAGTNHSNTEMLVMIEQHIKLISDAYPEGFELRTEAQLISKNIQISNSILYTIKTPDFCLPFKFYTQTENKPHVDYGKYFGILVEQLIGYAKARKLASNATSSSTAPVGGIIPPAPSTTPSIHPPFFLKKPIPTAPKKPAPSSIITPTKKGGVDELSKRPMVTTPSKLKPLAQALNSASSSPKLSRQSTPESPTSRPETPSNTFLRRK
ncbi:MAG: hypothetical protein ACYC0J_02175 [Gammaproteobacteria bacterium]